MLDYLCQSNPALAAKLKVIQASPAYGMPPVTVRADLDPLLKKRIQTILFGMDQNAEGKKILAQLKLRRLAPVSDTFYDSVRELAKAAGNP